MVRGCFGNNNVGLLHKVEACMTKETYKDILENQMLPSGDPKHKSKLCKLFKRIRRTRNPMDWSAQSPDLYQIELLRDELDRKVREDGPTSKNVLWDILDASWKKKDTLNP